MAMDLVDVHGRLLSLLLTRALHPRRGVGGDGVDAGTHSAHGRMPDAGDGAEGEERRSSPQGDSSGESTAGRAATEGSDRPTTSSQDGAGEEGAARPGCVASELGEAARGEAAGPRCDRRPTHGRETQLGPGAERPWESCET